MMEGIILIVIELKLYFKDLRDHFAKCCWNWHVSVPVIICTESNLRLTLFSGIPMQQRQRIRRPTSCLRNLDQLEGFLFPSI